MDRSSQREASFTHLPSEVLECVFLQIPMLDLLRTHVYVCKSWKEIILNPSFLPWKKVYLSFLMKRKSRMSAFSLDPLRKAETVYVNEAVREIIEKHHLQSLPNLLTNCIRYMGQFHLKPPSIESCSERLKLHGLYKTATDFLEWVPDTLLPRPYNAWHLIATILVLSDYMWDIRKLMKLLFSSNNIFSIKDVMESLYSLTTLYLASERTIRLPYRYHYNLQYALYTYENAYPCYDELKGPVPPTHYRYKESTHNGLLSPQQSMILRHKFQETDLVKIIGFAGSGKTSTLLRLAKVNPEKRFLLLTATSNVYEVARIYCADNVAVQTIYSVANRLLGSTFTNIVELINLHDIGTFLENGLNHQRSCLVRTTIERFTNSDDIEMIADHVPSTDFEGVPHNRYWVEYEKILNEARLVWQEMTRGSPTQKVPMTFDGLVKLWHVLRVQIYRFDVLLIDAAQDLNTCAMEAIMLQDMPKVFAGDDHQRRNARSSAVTSFRKLIPTHSYFLSRSFRFGPEIAFAAQCALKTALNVQHKPLIGGLKEDTSLAGTRTRYRNLKQKAYLTTTKYQLYKVAVRLCKHPRTNGVSIGFLSGVEGLGLEDVMDMYILSRIERDSASNPSMEIRNPLLAQFKNMEELKVYAAHMKDVDLANKIYMYTFRGRETPKLIEMIKRKCATHAIYADVVLGTVQEARGLEFDWVILADDMFVEGYHKLIDNRRFKYEKNLDLLYIAVTRAKTHLTINMAALRCLYMCGEKFERFAHSSELFMDTKCVQCGRICLNDERLMYFPPLYTKVQSVPLSCYGNILPGGCVCDECASLRVLEFPQDPRKRVSQRTDPVLKDFDRIARRTLITGNTDFQRDNQADRLLPYIRWDNYAALHPPLIL